MTMNKEKVAIEQPRPEETIESKTDIAGVVDQSNFCRKSLKFVVNPEDKQQVLEYIENHLPVHCFDKSAGRSQKTTSVYFDDKEHATYVRRKTKQDGSTLIRVRWYGDKTSKKVFVERKTHKNGAASIKERFDMKANKVEQFLAGQIAAESLTRPVLAGEIQAQINDSNRKLEPSIRTTYDRIAFQHEDSNKVRITADDNLIFSTESSEQFYGECTELNNAQSFPLMVLEIKLQDEFIEHPPSWLARLMESDLIEDASKFSKFASATEKLLL